MYIAYLNAEDSSNLEFDTPTGFTDNPMDKLINGEKNKQEAVIKHKNVEFFTPTEFALAFNDEQISDLGFIAVVDKDKKTLLGF